MLAYLKEFCQEIDFPEEAIEGLSLAYGQLEKRKESHTKFLELVEYYKEHNEKSEYEGIIGKLDEIAEETGINKFTLHMLYAIALSKHTRFLYEQKGIDDKIFLDTMYDLKAKLMECHQLHDVWGTFVFWWEIDLFNLNLIALGRLQFEVNEFTEDYQGEKYSLKPGDKVLNMHIPSGKPLDCDACKESFIKATEFYREYFADKPVAFMCNSWLLYPAHREFLPKTSNILKFMDFFDIISSKERKDQGYLWRIFYKDWEKEPKDLPRNSSLQRAYADWIMEGNYAGEGIGVFFIE